MDTYLSMKVFCQVVQSGSFTRAAELLGISIPMASKHVAHLEKTIQSQLLYRNNRHLKLTEQGEIYYRECVMALDILRQAENVVSAGTVKPSGILRVSLPLWFSCDIFANLIAEYRQQYPDVELILSLTNRRVDLNTDGEDLALRLSHQLPDNVIAKFLMRIPFYLVASPDYVARYGLPEHHEDLLKHEAILPSYTDLSQLVAQYQQQTVPLPMKGTLRSNNTQMIAALIRSGVGLGYMPAWLADTDLKAGRLVHILPDYQIKGVPLYAVYAHREFMNVRTRSFIDFFAEKWKN